ncbi:MAG TPA: hypothetical protein VMF13_08055 [Luteitalea sp.]|nr:hypothetical protein [Luteitalea sp.]
MLMIRDVYHCKPGSVRALVDKFKAMSPLGERAGMPKARIYTDVSAERFWTVVIEMDVESVDAFMKMGDGDAAAMKEMEAIMKGYHDLVDQGRREIYTVEA